MTATAHLLYRCTSNTSLACQSWSQPVTGSHNQVETSHITLILLWWHTVWQSLFEVCWRESCVQKWLAAWATIVKIAKRRGGKKTRKEAKILMWSNLVNRRKKQYEGGCENQNNNKNQKQLTYLLQARLKPPRNSGTECHPVCFFIVVVAFFYYYRGSITWYRQGLDIVQVQILLCILAHLHIDSQLTVQDNWSVWILLKGQYFTSRQTENSLFLFQ